jgi:hypothetical protein
MSTNAKPSIHLNGTSPDTLAEGYSDAGSALTKAIRALGETAPNLRDYYPQAPDAWNLAQAEHNARVDALLAVMRDLSDLYEYVADSTGPKGPRGA